MAYWLIKSEPGAWSWDDQVRATEPEPWTGVRNYAARKHMREMVKGDLAFFYHSVDEKRIVGICRVANEIHPDPTSPDDPRWECVDFEAVEPLPTPISMEDIKKVPALSNMVLVNNTRLSVQPVTEAEWKLICKMGGL